MIVIPENVKGLIFDCDGTLVDSMPLHMKAWEYAMNKFNSVFDYDFFFSPKGMDEKKIIEMYNLKYKTILDPVETVKVKHEYYRDHISAVRAITPIVSLVKKYKNILPMAVGSGSIKEFVYAQLKTVGIFECFTVILTANDPIKPKPEPDIFLEAAKHLHVEPEDCLVFEDGDPGIGAAQKAGMMVIDVRNYI